VPTVLVVEDEPALCELYELELQDRGYDVIIATSGKAALEAVDQHQIDVVVLDIAMPGMDGIEALGKILAVDNRLPVILNTAYTSYKDDFMSWAAEAYVVKSGDLAELLEHVGKALEKRGIKPPDDQGD
jgi:DNA-binding response OmpR family regulator